jgi:transcriptional regulator with XRE-family HTH domain
MVLLRHLLGDVLRRLRLRQGRTLREVSAAARVSLGYLSEVERGQKEASSELLAAICTALGTPLSQVFREVSDNFALAELQHEPVLTGSREPSLELPEGERLGSPVPALGSPGTALGSPGTDPRPRAQPLAFGEAPRIRGADDAASRLPDVTDMIPA